MFFRARSSIKHLNLSFISVTVSVSFLIFGTGEARMVALRVNQLVYPLDAKTHTPTRRNRAAQAPLSHRGLQLVWKLEDNWFTC